MVARSARQPLRISGPASTGPASVGKGPVSLGPAKPRPESPPQESTETHAKPAQNERITKQRLACQPRRRTRQMSLVKDFREFALKGNVIDLAVAVVIGAAFNKIVTGVVDD